MEIGKSFTLTEEELALLLLGKVGQLEEACVGVCFASLLSPSLTACLIWAIHLLPVNTHACTHVHVLACMCTHTRTHRSYNGTGHHGLLQIFLVNST